MWETRCGNKTRTEQVNGSAGGDFFFVLLYLLKLGVQKLRISSRGLCLIKHGPFHLKPTCPNPFLINLLVSRQTDVVYGGCA